MGRSNSRSETVSSSVESQLEKLLIDFAEFQARLTESIAAGRTSNHRIQVHVQDGLVTAVQQQVEDRRDFAKRSSQ